MYLDTTEVHGISKRLGCLDVRGKMLAAFIAVQAPDKEICSQMGLRPHEIISGIDRICGLLCMTHLDRISWRGYIRAAVLLVASPDPSPEHFRTYVAEPGAPAPGSAEVPKERSWIQTPRLLRAPAPTR